MTPQQGTLDIFGSVLVPPSEPIHGPVQTRRAGLRQASLTKATLWGRMLAIYAQGGATDAEMALALGVERSCVNARRDELIKAGKVRDSGTTRKNERSGVLNTVWGLV